MPLRYLRVVFICLVFTNMLLGQNYPVSNSYLSNTYLMNPAEAGSSRLHAFLNYRNQWVGMSGAPTITTVGANSLLNNTRIGLGFKFSSFNRGVQNSMDFAGTFAYAVPFENKSKLFFGLSAGALMNEINWAEIEDPTDPALVETASGVTPTANFGMMFQSEQGLHIGFALPKMMATSFDNTFAFSPLDNMVFSAYYSKRNDDKVKQQYNNKGKSSSKKKKTLKEVPLEVFALYRYSTIGNQAEGSVKYNFHSHIWLSATYRQYAGLIPGIGLNAGNLMISYFYELGVGSDIPLKTHEIMLGLRLGAENKFKEKIPPAVAKRAAAQQAIAKTTPPAKTPVPTTSPAKEAPKPTVKETPPVEKPKEVVVTEPVIAKEEPPVTQTPTLPLQNTNRSRFAAPVDTLIAAHTEERKELDKHLDDHVDGTHDDEHAHPVNERHEFVKRGTHHEELEEGTFVIAGAFKSRENAEHYAQSLSKMKFEADFGHLSVKNIWYVFVSVESDIEEAKKERNALQKNKIFKDVWLLTVHQ